MKFIEQNCTTIPQNRTVRFLWNHWLHTPRKKNLRRAGPDRP